MLVLGAWCETLHCVISLTNKLVFVRQKWQSPRFVVKTWLLATVLCWQDFWADERVQRTEVPAVQVDLQIKETSMKLNN